MVTNITDIVDKWNQEEPSYNELGKEVAHFIKNTITDYEILPEVSYRTKELHSIIKKINKKKREKDSNYDYNSLKDKLGIRIICGFKEDLEKVDDFIKNYFDVKKVEYKNETLDYDQLGYTSNHYDVTLKSHPKIVKNIELKKTITFEIQVRTLNQHAWSNSAHALSYKQEAELPVFLNRRIYRLLSLYEIADDEFSAVNNILINQRDNIIYPLLRNLESKFYKFAKVDYDRDTSLYALKIILSYFTDEEQVSIFKEINLFIEDHSSKIKRIFDENRHRFFELPILTQPEVFIIWYSLKKFYFKITDNWVSDFEEFELTQLQTLWGGFD